eukprot:GHVH01006943.1.p1 GENE.GHVH01006943.1~~GHVH01006943.1.p1  ORF type:complete len:388 (+),score=47.05 GHVH01006943.1:73-1164(+)
MSDSKVLLLGRANAGKTSMKSVIFASCDPVNTSVLGATHNIDHRRVTLLGELGVSLWDCGGQDVYLESYFQNSKDLVFQNVEVLIFVLECRVECVDPENDTAGDKWQSVKKDMDYLRRSLETLIATSPNSKVFVLVHKMDILSDEMKESTLTAYRTLIQKEIHHLIPDDQIMGTSIWDESLYHAWSLIVRALIPQVERLEQLLSKLATVIHANDLILVEKETFLTIAHATPHISIGYRNAGPETNLTPVSFERLSNVIKQFKLSCHKVGGDFHTIQVNLTDSSLIIEQFTENMYIVIALPNRDANLGAVMLNLDLASNAFEELGKMPRSGYQSDDNISDGVGKMPRSGYQSDYHISDGVGTEN